MDRRRNILNQSGSLLNGSDQCLYRSLPTKFDLNNNNIVPNTTFDTGVTGWSGAAGGSLSLETTIKRTGLGSMKLTSGGTNSRAVTALFPVAGTLKFEMEAWIYCPASNVGKNAFISITNQSGSAILQGSTTAITPTDTWKKLSISGTLPGTQTGIIARIQFTNPSAGDVLYFDDVKINVWFGAIILAGVHKIVDTGAASYILNYGNADVNGSAGWCLKSRDDDANNIVSFYINDGTNKKVIHSTQSIINGQPRLIAISINFRGNLGLWVDAESNTPVDMTGMTNIAVAPDFVIGANQARSGSFFNGIILPYQIILLGAIPADSGATIVADAYSRFKNKKPFSKFYQNGIIIADYDGKSPYDFSGYGNHLTSVNIPPITQI